SYTIAVSIVLSVTFFTAASTTEIYTLSLHDALPISCRVRTAEISFTYDNTAPTTTVGQLAEIGDQIVVSGHDNVMRFRAIRTGRDRKSTRLNSSHRTISYAVFCLKKKNNNLLQNNVL